MFIEKNNINDQNGHTCCNGTISDIEDGEALVDEIGEIEIEEVNHTAVDEAVP